MLENKLVEVISRPENTACTYSLVLGNFFMSNLTAVIYELSNLTYVIYELSNIGNFDCFVNSSTAKPPRDLKNSSCTGVITAVKALLLHMRLSTVFVLSY